MSKAIALTLWQVVAFLARELLATLALAFRVSFRLAGRAYRFYCERQAAQRVAQANCRKVAMRETLEAVRKCWWRLKPAQRVRVLAWFNNVDVHTLAHDGAAIIAAEMKLASTPSERLAAHDLAKRETSETAKRQAIMATRELLARIDGKKPNALQCV